MVSGIILDGYTVDFQIPEDPEGYYPEVKLQFRPLSQIERVEVKQQLEKAGDPVKAERYAASVMAKQVLDWDLKDHTGKEVKRTTENFERLEPHLSGKIFNLVMCLEPAIDPKAAQKN